MARIKIQRVPRRKKSSKTPSLFTTLSKTLRKWRRRTSLWWADLSAVGLQRIWLPSSTLAAFFWCHHTPRSSKSLQVKLAFCRTFWRNSSIIWARCTEWPALVSSCMDREISWFRSSMHMHWKIGASGHALSWRLFAWRTIATISTRTWSSRCTTSSRMRTSSTK